MRRITFPAAFAVALISCQSTLGPATVRRGMPSYNDAVANATNAQLLLNLVRLRYRDNPIFVDMGAITQQETVTGTLGLNSTVNHGAGVPTGESFGLPISGSYSETPTIVMTPLQGDAFFHRMMSPLPLDSVLLLTTSGWNIERALSLVLNRINDIHNAETAAGPTPDRSPRFNDMRELLQDLRVLQVDETLTIGADVAKDGARDLVMEIREDPAWEKELSRIRELLGIHAGKRYVFTTRLLAREPEKIAVETRSLLGVMFYLSQVVQIPDEDVQRGLVTVTRTPEGHVFDWQLLIGNLFQVRAAESQPAGAYVSVPYRGHWFFIADNDLESKTTFMLLTQLFNVQAGSAAAPAPTLTIGAH